MPPASVGSRLFIAVDRYVIMSSEVESPAVDTSHACAWARSAIVGCNAESRTESWIFHASSRNTMDTE